MSIEPGRDPTSVPAIIGELSHLRLRLSESQDMWQCPKCRSEVDNSFEICWSCGTTPDGIEDPDFVTADEANRVASKQPQASTAMSLADFAGRPVPDVVECYMASDTTEATVHR